MKVSRTVRACAAVLVAVFVMKVPLVVAETIPGWEVYSDAQPVQISLEQATAADGKPSVHLRLASGEPSERVSFFQSVRAGPYLGHAIKITANVKTLDFKGQVALAAATYDGSPYLYTYSHQIKDAGKAHAWQ